MHYSQFFFKIAPFASANQKFQQGGSFMRKNNTGYLSPISIMLMGLAGLRPATPAEIKMLSDFLRAEAPAD